MLPIHTILYPTDFSENAGFAFRLACSLARDFGARIVVLHVATPPPMGNFGGMPVVPPPADQDSKELTNQLHQFRAPDSSVHVEYRLTDGFAVPEILRVAEEVECGMIVMGTHGRSGFRRVLMGSVAEHIVRKAKCPVLTVKTPMTETAKRSAASQAATVGQ